MTTWHIPVNRARTTVSSGVLNNTTTPITFAVADGSVFGSSFPMYAYVENEQMVITARSSNNLTATRASAVAHPGTPVISAPLAAENITEIQSAVDAKLTSPLTTKGDIHTYSTVDNRLAVGTDGYVLTADAASTNGIKWAASGGGGGKLNQVVEGVTTGVVSGSTQIPPDNTKPQNTEGFEVITVSITPGNASSTLLIEAFGYGSMSTTGVDLVCAIFKDSTADAIGANIIRPIPVAGGFFMFQCSATVSAGSTSARTYKLRVGPDASATVYVNADNSSNQYFNGLMRTYIRVTEVLP